MNNVIANRRHRKQVFYSLNSQIDAMNGDALQVGLQNFMVHVSAKAMALDKRDGLPKVKIH